MRMVLSIFIDTGVFIAANVKNDDKHARAAAKQRLGKTIFLVKRLCSTNRPVQIPPTPPIYLIMRKWS